MIGAMQAARVTAQLTTRLARQIADELRREGWPTVTTQDVQYAYGREGQGRAWPAGSMGARISRALAERGVACR